MFGSSRMQCWDTGFRMVIYFLLWVCVLIGGIWSLKFVKLDVPGALMNGDPVWLRCGFDLEGDELYSVKWYKNNVEFYRYLPSDLPPGQKYDLLGVNVDLYRSNETHVFLYKTDLNTEGMYGCEVSTEAPSFRTVKADKELRVYVIPTKGPVIDGIDPPYQIGDTVNISCSSGLSKPPTHLRWFLNEIEVPPSYEERFPHGRYSNGLQGTRVGLNFEVDYSHFWKGEIRIVCVASIPQVFSSTSEEIVIGDRGSSVIPYHVSHSTAGQKGPTINGNLPWYDVGDIININCTSAMSPTPAHLRWFVNDHESRSEYVTKYPVLHYADGSESSVLGLRLRVEHHHFKNDELRLKCTCRRYKMITMFSEKTLLRYNQQSSGFHTFDSAASANHRCWLCRQPCRTLVTAILVLAKFWTSL